MDFFSTWTNVISTKITFFGILFDTESIHPDLKKVETTRAIQEPQNSKRSLP